MVADVRKTFLQLFIRLILGCEMQSLLTEMCLQEKDKDFPHFYSCHLNLNP